MREEIHDSSIEIFCSYCNGSIEKNETYNETYIVKNGEKYHLDCWNQINTRSPDDYLNEQK